MVNEAYVVVFLFSELQSPSVTAAAYMANSLEFVCLLQSRERSRPYHRHVSLPTTVSKITQ